jgi:acetolactate synthase-1/2/3 large subunit
MIGAAAEQGIAFTLAHGETAASIMAGTYGLVCGSVGVCVVTRGPGFTSAMNGCAQATLDRFPLMLVSDTVSEAARSRVGHQRIDQVQAAAAVTKWSGTLGTSDPVGVVRGALEAARSTPAGAVHLAFDPTTGGSPEAQVPAVPSSSDEDIMLAHELLAAARKPLFIVGEDAARHHLAVRAALAHVTAPILSTYQGGGVVPPHWSSYAGLFTGVQADAPLLQQADLIVGIGLDSIEPMPMQWPTDLPVVIFHTAAADVGFYGDARLIIGPYQHTLPPADVVADVDWSSDAGAEWATSRREQLLIDDPGLHPLSLVAAVLDQVPSARVTVDAGAHMLAVMPLWPISEPRQVLISNGLATMGFAVPAAIGVALARPHERVVAFTGDGGLGMVLAELETLARAQLPVTVVVFNDANLSLIELKQGSGQGDRGAVGYGPMDFAGIAASMGIQSAVATTIEQVTMALRNVGDDPFLLDARINPSFYRHIMKAVRG